MPNRVVATNLATPGSFRNYRAPAVDEVAPRQGSRLGGQRVVVRGRNFQQADLRQDSPYAPASPLPITVQFEVQSQ